MWPAPSQVVVPLPDEGGRQAILGVHLRNVPMPNTEDKAEACERLAKVTAGGCCQSCCHWCAGEGGGACIVCIILLAKERLSEDLAPNGRKQPGEASQKDSRLSMCCSALHSHVQSLPHP